MSGWDSWNNHVMAVQGVASGGIYTHQGAACAENGHKLSPTEIQNLVSSFAGGASSATLNGEKYMMLRADSDSMHCRNKSTPASIYKTNTLLIVGIGQPSASAEVLSVGLSKVAAMLTELNM